MKQTLRLLLLLMALLLASVSGFAETRRDRLWGADSPSCDRAALLPQHARFGAAPRYDYEPAPQSHQPRPTSRIPDYYKFNPYNLLPYGWLRRLLKASHPHARADYYVYALRHILR